MADALGISIGSLKKRIAKFNKEEGRWLVDRSKFGMGNKKTKQAARDYAAKECAERMGSSKSTKITEDSPEGKSESDEKEPKEPKPTRAEVALLSENAKKFDPDATKEDCIADIRGLQEQDLSVHWTRIHYRIDGKYSESTWSRFFGNFAEFRKQSGLEPTRQQGQLEKHIAKHASHDHYREFFESEVLPFHNKYVKKDRPGHIKTLMIGSDIHDTHANLFCLSTFIAECARVQPDIIILNGDIFDLYDFSRYDKDPRNIQGRSAFTFVREMIFRPLRESCPDSQIYLFVKVLKFY